MRQAADVPRRVAIPQTAPEAAARLYQALYGCTMHPSGVLHAIGGALDAEALGRFSLADVAAQVAARADQARDTASPAEAWRLAVMIQLCDRLTLGADRVVGAPRGHPSACTCPQHLPSGDVSDYSEED